MIIIKRNKIFIIFIVQIILLLALVSNSYATDIIVSSDITENLINQYYISTSNNNLITNKFLLNQSYENLFIFYKTVGTNILTNRSSFDLRNYYDIEVKNQGTTESCWTFSLLSSMEINMLIKTGTTVDLSERHMNYATSNSFYDGTNEYAFNRTAADGGSFIIGLAYLTNGQGAVLEDEMEFSNNTTDISIDEIDIEPSYYVTEYEILPSIYKVELYGETLYTDGYDTYYSDDEVDELRQIIKQHIVENGGVVAYTAASAYQFYNNTDDVFESTAYYCNDMTYPVDHAVTIIGWDDTYSKEYFTGSATPEKDGAYIVLNSYSDDVFDNGYLYISYEDVWIESILYGITETSTIDYDNLYQHNEFGANVPITLQATDGQAYEEEYFASIFSRDENVLEELTDVAVSSNQYAEFEVYVNPDSSDLSSENLELVATTDILSPGYNTISFDGIELTGSEFAVVIKQKAIDQTCYIMLEAKIENTMYSTASSTLGNSMVSLDGNNWYNLADLDSIVYDSYIVDLSDADVCIKAFTNELGDKNISSDVYKISSDNYITKIYDETTVAEFLSNIVIEEDYEIIDKNNNQVTDYTSYVTTNMILKVGDENYILVVRGDMNCDGKITLTDISKQVLHYVNYEGFILTGAQAMAADINLDGNFTLTDVSQLQLIYVNKR